MGTVRDALQLPDMRRIEVGYGLSITGELAGTVALVVYAVDAGGAALISVYAASRTLAGMGVALVLAGGVLAAAAVRVTRLGRAFIAGMLLWGVPLAFLALRPAAALAYLALVVVGIGNAVVTCPPSPW